MNPIASLCVVLMLFPLLAAATSPAETSPAVVAEHLQRARDAMRRFQLEAAEDALGRARLVSDALACEAPATKEALLAVALFDAELRLASADSTGVERAMHEALAVEAGLTLDDLRHPPPLHQALHRVRALREAAPREALEVQTEPTGAELWLNGVSRSTTPARVGELPAVPHRLCVQREGWVDRGLFVTPASGQPAVHVRLERAQKEEPPLKGAWQPEPVHAARPAEVARAAPLWKRPWFWIGTAAVGAAAAGTLVYVKSRGQEPRTPPPIQPEITVVCCR